MNPIDPPRRQPWRSRQSGFALLITVVLLSFLVLLLVSLAALTRVETQVASNTQDVMQARQNALMALNIALGELQKTAGPDQRTTAPAVLGEGATAVMAANAADNGLAAPVNGSRYWTGVWGNKNAPETIFTSAPSPVLLQWLVSGNERFSTFTVAGDGHITSPTAAAVTPFNPTQAVTLAGGGALSPAVSATSALVINGRPAALLLGPKTAGQGNAVPPETPPAPETLYVAAPLVDISSSQVPGLTGPARVGRYAWWVGDEGVKAKYNLPDPYIANSDTKTDRDARYRALAAQRNGIERVTPYDDTRYPIASTSPTNSLYLGVRNTINNAGMRLGSSTLDTNALRKNVHDLTTYSYGVLADSQFGGLRRDLTFHLDPQSGDTFFDGRNILPDGSTPTSTFAGSKYTAHPSLYSEATANGGMGYTTLNLSPRLGPKWDQLKSFYKLAYDQPGDLEVQPAVDIDVNPVKVQTAITPVILDIRTLFVLRAGPSIDTALTFVIGNPYTRKLTAPDGLDIRISLLQNRYKNSERNYDEWRLTSSYKNSPTESSVNLFKWGGDSYPLIKYPPTPAGDGPIDPDAGYPGVLDYVIFRIPANLLELAPGEAKAYTLASSPDRGDETIEGMVHKVKELREMQDSSDISYFNHVCDPHYVNDASQFPPGFFTGSPLPAGAEFKWKAYFPTEGGAGYTLTVKGKPKSVLQRAGPFYSPTFSGSVSSLETPFGENIVASLVVRYSRVFQHHNNQEKFHDESLLINHAEANLLGSFQSLNTSAPNQGDTHVLRYRQTRSYDLEEVHSGFDTENATQAAWGRGFAGNPLLTSPHGKWVITDIPVAAAADEVPLLSMGQLQHADLSADDEAIGTAVQGGNLVGNSWYNRFVSRAASRTDPMSNFRSQRNSNQNDNSASAFGDSPRWFEGYVPHLTKNAEIRYYDIRYLLNTALWDGYFLSTVRPAAGSDATVAPAPANRRLVYTGETNPTLGQLRGADNSTAIPQAAALAVDEVGRSPAAQMLINGAFNINSTSEKAWIALLSSQRGLGLNDAPATSTLTPFARSIRQPGSVQITPSSPITTQKANAARAAIDTYVGFRALTDAEIATLATEIVKQVRARGPFLSVAQFVNRHLTAAAAAGNAVADTGLTGALQQAIDRTGLNAGLNYESVLNRATNNRANAFPDNSVMPTGDASGLSPHMGVPGWLSQADVLQAIAPSLAARSDTFVIRTYGEVVDPVNSAAAPAAPVVKGRAWCEAVVQRMPEYLDASDRPTLSQANTNAQNQAFGRRFRIVSFRWLSSNDI